MAELKKFIRRVPVDDEGYTQSFTPDQQSECTNRLLMNLLTEFRVKEFLDQYGFGVIKCLSTAECAATVAELFSDVNEQASATQKMKINPVRSSNHINIVKLTCTHKIGGPNDLGERELAQSKQQVLDIKASANSAGVQQSHPPRAVPHVQNHLWRAAIAHLR